MNPHTRWNALKARRINPVTVADFPAGSEPKAWHPGDLLLTHNSLPWWRLDGITSAAIRLGQRLVYRGPDRPYCWANHVALVVEETGAIIEAGGSGVASANASKYQEQDYRVVHTHLEPADAARFVVYATSHLGDQYGFIEIVSLAITCLTGTSLLFLRDGTYICSSLAACALSQTGVIFPKLDIAMMPADVAHFYGVKP